MRKKFLRGTMLKAKKVDLRTSRVRGLVTTVRQKQVSAANGKVVSSKNMEKVIGF